MTFRVDIQGQLCAGKGNVTWGRSRHSYTGIGSDITCKAIGLGQTGNYLLYVIKYHPKQCVQYF